MDHLVNGSPIGQASQITVVNPQIGLELAGEPLVVFLFLFGIVAIDGIEFQSSAPAKLHGIVQVLSFSIGPQNQAMAFFRQFAEGVYGKGELLPDGGVPVLYNGSIKIDCYYHQCSFLGYAKLFVIW